MMPHHDGHHTDNVSPFLIITTKHCIVKYRFPGLLPNRGSASMSSISRRTRKDQLWYKFHSNIFSKVIFSWFYLWGVWGSDLIFSGSVMTSREIGRKSSVATVRWIFTRCIFLTMKIRNAFSRLSLKSPNLMISLLYIWISILIIYISNSIAMTGF